MWLSHPIGVEFPLQLKGIGVSEEGRLLAGRYRLQRYLGGGAMGAVWQAEDELLHRVVAVKQLLIQPNLDPASLTEARERAMREGRVAARLHHPNAIAIHDVIKDDDLPVLVMEYLPSRSLAQVLDDSGPLPPGQVAEIGAQIASALAAAHAVGIMHRDIKPGNVLISEDGTVKLTDFGVSRAADDVGVTQTGILAGTPAYLAPELARGYDAELASDVFSLGSTLYAAAEGEPPFGYGENSIALLHAVASGEFPPPQHAGPLTGLLLTMLRSEPQQRPLITSVSEQLSTLAQQINSGEADTDWFGPPIPASMDPRGRDRPSPAGSQPTQAAATGVGKTGATGTKLAPASPRELEPKRKRSAWPWAIVAAVVVLLTLGGFTASRLLTASEPPPPTPSEAALEQAASDYYRSLPSNPEAAWLQLSPTLQTDKQRFLATWSAVSTVNIVSAPKATSPNTVSIGIQLAMKDRSTAKEFHSLSFTPSGPKLLISADTLLYSEKATKKSSTPKSTTKPEDDKKKEEKEKDEKGGDKSKGDTALAPPPPPPAQPVTATKTTTVTKTTTSRKTSTRSSG